MADVLTKQEASFVDALRTCPILGDGMGPAACREAAAIIDRLAAENRRLREALERELKRLLLLSIQGKSAASHWEGCDSSQGHSVCYSIKLIRAALAGKDGYSCSR